MPLWGEVDPEPSAHRRREAVRVASTPAWLTRRVVHAARRAHEGTVSGETSTFATRPSREAAEIGHGVAWSKLCGAVASRAHLDDHRGAARAGRRVRAARGARRRRRRCDGCAGRRSGPPERAIEPGRCFGAPIAAKV